MSKKILIIDDSALMRRVISDIIKSGNEYEVAAIAKAAWRDTNISARIRHFTVQLFLILICQR